MCVCIPEKQPLLPEVAVKCHMKRFPGKVIKINDPYEAMLSCSLHRSCKSTTSITDVRVIFHLVSLPGDVGCGNKVRRPSAGHSFLTASFFFPSH